MRRIKKVSDGSLIIQKEDSALFFHLDETKEIFNVKEQFVTVDGYEESISFGLDLEELKALASVVNHAVFQLENEDFVATGEQLVSDIHFKAKNKEEAEHEST